MILAGLDQLRTESRMTQAYYYAKNSSRNVLSHIRQWLFFSIFFKLCILPASIDDVILFVELMAITSGYDHIKNLIGSIAFLHKVLDLPFERESFRLRLTLQSLKRKLARAPLQALPISIEHLQKMYQFVNLDDPADLAIWTSILVGFFGLFRKMNLVPEDLKDLDSFKILTRRKILLDNSRGVALILVNFAKNNQFGQKELVVPLISNKCRALDPVFHLNLLFSQTSAPPDSPAFTYKKQGRLQSVSYKTFTARLKSLLSQAGLSPEQYSGHSLRRGGASFLHACGASHLQIQASGDWASSVFTKYLYITLEQRLQSQMMMAQNIL
jgi:hypothetical protein